MNPKKLRGTVILSTTVPRFLKENKRMFRNCSEVPIIKFSFNNRCYYTFHACISNSVNLSHLVLAEKRTLRHGNIQY